MCTLSVIIYENITVKLWLTIVPRISERLMNEIVLSIGSGVVKHIETIFVSFRAVGHFKWNP